MGDPLGGGGLPPLNTAGSSGMSSSSSSSSSSNPLGSGGGLPGLNQYKGEAQTAKPSYYDVARARILAKAAAAGSISAPPTAGAKADPYKLNITGTGAAFSKKKFNKELKKQLRKYSSSYSGVKKKEAKILGDVITKQMKGKSVGSDISASDRRKMRGELTSSYKDKNMSKGDLARFKKIVGNLGE